MQISSGNYLRHLLIRSHWKKWLVPVICLIPYLFSLFWLILRGQSWIAQIMLTPLFMGFAVAVLGLLLARSEFRR